MISHAWADQRGFTFTEFLVGISVLALMVTGLATLMMSGNQTYATGTNQVEAQQAARVALERIVREIRGAGFNPTGAACPPNCPIGGATNGSNPTYTVLGIQNDTDGDGTFEDNERIVYTLNGTDLQRQDFAVENAPQIVMRGIRTLIFVCVDQDGNATSTPQNIRSVWVILTAQPANQAGSYQGGRVSVTMHDMIRLRNR